jgi:small subunit ribosomal protein S20
MANTKSAIKRMRQNERRRLKNRVARSRVRTALKGARAAITGNVETARVSVKDAIRSLDKAVTKGIVHRNTTARKKSRLMKQLAALRAN